MLGSSPRGIQVDDVDTTRSGTPYSARTKAPALLMQRDTVEAIFEPIGRFAPGTDGVFDLYQLPAYDIASLYHVDGAWKLSYAFRGASAVAGIKQADPMMLEAA